MKNKYHKYGHHKKKVWNGGMADHIYREIRLILRKGFRVLPLQMYKEWGRHAVCPNGCNPTDTMWYSARWDRYLCRPCDLWLEDGCSCKADDNVTEEGYLRCYFECWKCPAKPSESRL